MKHFQTSPNTAFFSPSVETTPKKKSRAANSNHHPKNQRSTAPRGSRKVPAKSSPSPRPTHQKHHFFNSARIQVKKIPLPIRNCTEIKQKLFLLDAGSAR